MEGGDFTNELDCNSFFDQMDDLVQFPADTDSGLFSGGSSDLSDIWSNPLPYEDIAQLEWISNFVEDSFSNGGLTITKASSVLNKESSCEEFQTSSPVSTGSSFTEEKPFPPSPSQRGVRTKRPRPATFNPPSFPTSRVPSGHENVAIPLEGKKLPKPKAASSQHKKKKIKPNIPLAPVEVNNQNATGENVRKCLHCEITKTPQWRAGPMGPKTLCNACGVRYKSGRLFPEYRPAASPTFVASLHSNSHRKVVEMRNRCDESRAREMPDQSELIPNTTTTPFD